MHRDTAMESEAAADTPVDEMDEIRARLIRKLPRLKKRYESTQAEPQQLRDSRPDGPAEKRVGGKPASRDSIADS
jgi:hypothetical protein